MSLDLSIVCKHCGAKAYESEVNITYNLGRMWREAVPGAERLVEIEGMTGAESLAVLEPAIKTLEADPHRFRAFNPENGWGSYEGLLVALRRLADAARAHPESVWRASR